PSFRVIRIPFVAPVLALAACVPQIRERCALVTDRISAPASLPSDFAAIDALLLERAGRMVEDAQELRGSLARSFRIYFADEPLPLLCGRLERARTLAIAGRTREAGVKYQSLLLASQVIELAISVHATAEYADEAGEPVGAIQQKLEVFGSQMAPLLDA